MIQAHHRATRLLEVAAKGSIFVENYAINHHRVALTTVMNMHRHTYSDPRLDGFFVKRFSTARHVGHGLTKTISSRT